jgi:hypothetical protein
LGKNARDRALITMVIAATSFGAMARRKSGLGAHLRFEVALIRMASASCHASSCRAIGAALTPSGST